MEFRHEIEARNNLCQLRKYRFVVNCNSFLFSTLSVVAKKFVKGWIGSVYHKQLDI